MSYTHQVTRRARKRYRCIECFDAIEPGQRYMRCAVLDGEAWTYRLCLPCGEMLEFAWTLIGNSGINPDDGPRFGECAEWLADEEPETLAKMPAEVRARFEMLLKRVQDAAE